VARVLRWGKRTAYKWVDLAEEGGLIEVRTEGNRKRLYPVEDAPLEEAAFRLLPEPETLAQELGEELTYVHPVHGGWEKSVLSFPQTACTTPPKTEENALLDEENQCARHVHERAREEEKSRLGEEKPRAQGEVPFSSQKPEERARPVHAPRARPGWREV
jgi:hypothetical protein